MAIANRQMSVTATRAVAVADSTTTIATPRVLLKNRDSANSVYLGDSAVTSGNGFELKPADAPLALELRAGESLYAVCATNQTARLDILAIGD